MCYVFIFGMLYLFEKHLGEEAMITVSLCMIVKNEEKVLARCLDSLVSLVDEMVIVDTGSTDRTREIAAGYGARVYEFDWVDDFSAARNFAFSKACCEYIYSADADEVLTEENQKKFRILKESLLPEIEIVQMKYGNQLEHGSVYNFDEEYRPKLFKRKRDFVWEEPIHEIVRLEPVVYDSDIVVSHLPENSHAKRDFSVFAKCFSRGERISKRLHNFYARELMIAGEREDFIQAEPFFEASAADTERSREEVLAACCVMARAARLTEDVAGILKYTSKVLAEGANSEICCELGYFHEAAGDYEEAVIWYYNAAYEVQPILKLKAGKEEPLEGLIRCYEKLGQEEQAESYRRELEQK